LSFYLLHFVSTFFANLHVIILGTHVYAHSLEGLLC
jgi:hypothetical protein